MFGGKTQPENMINVTKTSTLPFVLLENLSWACHFAIVCAATSLLKFFKVQGKDQDCESVKTIDYMLFFFS